MRMFLEISPLNAIHLVRFNAVHVFPIESSPDRQSMPFPVLVCIIFTSALMSDARLTLEKYITLPERSRTTTPLYRYGQMFFFLFSLHLRVKVHIHLVFFLYLFISVVVKKYPCSSFVALFSFGRRPLKNNNDILLNFTVVRLNHGFPKNTHQTLFHTFVLIYTLIQQNGSVYSRSNWTYLYSLKF